MEFLDIIKNDLGCLIHNWFNYVREFRHSEDNFDQDMTDERKKDHKKLLEYLIDQGEFIIKRNKDAFELGIDLFQGWSYDIRAVEATIKSLETTLGGYYSRMTEEEADKILKEIFGEETY